MLRLSFLFSILLLLCSCQSGGRNNPNHQAGRSPQAVPIAESGRSAVQNPYQRGQASTRYIANQRGTHQRGQYVGYQNDTRLAEAMRRRPPAIYYNRDGSVNRADPRLSQVEQIQGYSQRPRPPQPRAATKPKVVPAPVAKRSDGAPRVRAGSYIMVDANSGKLLSAKNANSRRAVASTQKLLTALVVLETGNLDKKIRVAKSDTMVEPTKLGIKTGQYYTRRKLFDNAGSVAGFSRKMNAYARRIGMKNSYFKNPHGLTESGQKSTAADIVILARKAYQNRFIREAVKTRSYKFYFTDGRTRTLYNTNKALRNFGPCDGMKTGYTSASGRCLVSSARQNGKSIVLVQLGSTSKSIFKDAINLMRWGLRKA